MITKKHIFQLCIPLLFCFLQTEGIAIYGQNNRPYATLKRSHQQRPDSMARTTNPLPILADSLETEGDNATAERRKALVADSIAEENKKRMLELTSNPTVESPEEMPTDSLQQALNHKQWIPDPTKATWLALVIPGGGQIYNRKFWKLPIFYGGFAGCAYALTWNGKMYKDYSNAYREAVNGNWNSSSIQDLLPPGYLNQVSTSQLTETLRRRKDTYRRWRDLSIFAFIGVYLLSVVDAYVDAELSNFDISPDLSMKVEPVVMDNEQISTSLDKKSVGVQCSFRF